MKGCINLALSVDGFIATKDGGVDWLNNQPKVEGEDFGFSDFMKCVDLMIMGRNTFDTVVGFGKETWYYGDLPIIVLTKNVHNVQIPDWVPPSVSVRSFSSPEELWKELETSEAYISVYVDGGKTIQSFFNAGLIHQMSLTSIPILLGEGITLFGGAGSKQRSLKHVSTKSYSNGFVVTTYDVNYESCDA